MSSVHLHFNFTLTSISPLHGIGNQLINFVVQDRNQGHNYHHLIELKDRADLSCFVWPLPCHNLSHMQATMLADKKSLNSTFLNASKKAAADGETSSRSGTRTSWDLATRRRSLPPPSPKAASSHKKKAARKKKTAPKRKLEPKNKAVSFFECHCFNFRCIPFYIMFIPGTPKRGCN